MKSKNCFKGRYLIIDFGGVDQLIYFLNISSLKVFIHFFIEFHQNEG